MIDEPSPVYYLARKGAKGNPIVKEKIPGPNGGRAVLISCSWSQSKYVDLAYNEMPSLPSVVQLMMHQCEIMQQWK